MGFPVRYGVAIQIFFACFVSYMIRTCLSINIMAMVTTRASDQKNVTSECITSSENITATKKPLPDYGPRYDWSRTDQGTLLGAYFLGYLLTCIPGGILSDSFGPTRVALISTAIAGILTILIPLGAQLHVWVVIIMRFIIGLTCGVLYPALQTLIARWAPITEKGKFTSALMGNSMGTMVTFPFVGAIVESIGWIWGFVIPGAISLVWCVTWFFTVADSPSVHWFIGETEREFLKLNVAVSVNKKKKAAPYLKMFKNIPFWALVVAHFGNLWGLYLLLTNGPMYMKEVLGFNLKSSGGLSALPHLARLIFGILFGSTGDFLKKRGYLSTVMLRKTFTIFSHIIPGFLMLSILLARCNAIFAVTVLMLALGSNGAATVTNLQNCQDLSPNFAGTVFGIINCIGSITGYLTPYLTAVLTKEKSDVEEWNIVYGIGSAMYIGCAAVFIIFGSGSEQPFNKIETEETQQETT